MKKQQSMNVTTAVNQVLDYLYEDEKAHYDECPPEERAGHIFPALERLRQWLHEPEPSTPKPSAP